MRAVSLLSVLALALAGCPKSTAPADAGDVDGGQARLPRAPRGPPLHSCPEVQTATLSNGLEVRTSSRTTRCRCSSLRVVLEVPTDADPEGKEGLSSVTFDMMDEGAGGRTSRRPRQGPQEASAAASASGAGSQLGER